MSLFPIGYFGTCEITLISMIRNGQPQVLHDFANHFYKVPERCTYSEAVRASVLCLIYKSEKNKSDICMPFDGKTLNYENRALKRQSFCRN